jgi:GTP-binding protein EngB required for normal cell division
MMEYNLNSLRLKDIYNICVLGNTGVGKSALLNMLAGDTKAFKISSSYNSQTQITQSEIYNFMGNANQIQLRLIDTQGLTDTGGDRVDMIHIKNMVDKIKELDEIDLFLLCLDGQNPRFTPYIKETVNLFINIFPDFLYHTVLIFNKWNTAHLDQFRIVYQTQYQTKFKKEFNFDKSIPCYFIDSFFNLKLPRENIENGTIEERYLHPNLQERTKAQVIGLVNYLVNKNSVCDVSDIRPHPTKRRKLEENLENERKEKLAIEENLRKENDEKLMILETLRRIEREENEKRLLNQETQILKQELKIEDQEIKIREQEKRLNGQERKNEELEKEIKKKGNYYYYYYLINFLF